MRLSSRCKYCYHQLHYYSNLGWRDGEGTVCVNRFRGYTHEPDLDSHEFMEAVRVAKAELRLIVDMTA